MEGQTTDISPGLYNERGGEKNGKKKKLAVLANVVVILPGRGGNAKNSK